MLKVSPVVTGRELFARRQFVDRRHRHDQEAPLQGFCHQFRLRLRPDEVADQSQDTHVFVDRLRPTPQERHVPDPVFVACGLVAVSLLVQPLHETA